MCDKEVETDLWSLAYFPDHFKTEEMCKKAVEKDPLLLIEVPGHLKTQEMCNEAVEKKFIFIGICPRPFKDTRNVG